VDPDRLTPGARPERLLTSPAVEKQAAQGRRERAYPEDTDATEDAATRRFAAAGGPAEFPDGPLIMACATVAELKAARGAGLGTALIGLRGCNGLPEGRLVSFGLAGALRDDLPSGTVLDAVRVVDAVGETLWSGQPLGVPKAREATILATEDVVDDPAERRALHERTGADAVDLESGTLARTGRLAGCLRVVSDTPARRLNGICDAVTPAGRYDWLGMARAFARAPRGFAQAAADGKRALTALRQAAEGLAA
jgi:hypothetical protein